MKKRLIYSLSLLFLFFSIGVGLTVWHTYRVTKNLESVVNLHRIEIVRKDLVINLQTVQGNLYTEGTVFGKELDVIVGNVTTMDHSIQSCSGCHHSQEMTSRLQEVSNMIEQYKEAISYLITTTANPERVERLKMVAVGIGDSLLSKTQEMAFIADRNLTNKTINSLNDINKSRFILFTTLLVTFCVGIVIAIALTKQTTRPVYELVKAVREITSGNLGHTITYQDKTEFGELANAFNKMAQTLQDNINRIEESERRYRMLFESAGEAIFIFDAEGKNMGRIVAANKTAAEMHGYTVDELLLMNITDLDAPGIAAEASYRIRKILNGEWINEGTTHSKKNGIVFPVEVSAGLFEYSKHKYILSFNKDITERKEADEKIRRAEQMIVCGEVTTGLAHEIKNPLAGIKASIGLFSETASLTSSEKDILQKVVHEIKRIESLIRDILDFAKPPRPQFSSVDINKLIEHSLTFSIQSLSFAHNSSKQIHVMKDFDAHLPEIMADPLQLNQIFINLFINAADAMTGGGTLSIRTMYDTLKESVHINISDTGGGIEDEMLEQIFQPFFTTKPKGTGLGLAISKRLIEQQGGMISVKNNPDGGATFMIEMPVRKVEKAHLI